VFSSLVEVGKNPVTAMERRWQRRRTVFSGFQLDLLRLEFARCPNPNSRRRRLLAQYLELPPRSVLFWFQVGFPPKNEKKNG